MSDRLFRRRRAGRPVGCWIAKVREGGRWVNRSTRCLDLPAARAVARQWERDLADPAAARARDAQSVTLAQAVAVALTAYRGRVAAGKASAETVEDFYATKVGQWRRVIGDRYRLAALDASTVDAFIAQRRGDGVSDHTIKKELVAISITLRHARRIWPTLPDPATVLPVRFGAGYRPRERVLTRDELAALLDAMLHGHRANADHAARTAFIVATGARWTESCHARRDDLALEYDRVHLRGTKTASSLRTVPVAPSLRSLLAFAARGGRGVDGWLFAGDTSYQWVLHRATRRLTAEGRLSAPASANDLRRTCGTWLAEAGATPHQTARVLGHATSDVTERVYYRPSVDALARLLDAACTKDAPKPPDTDALTGLLGRSDLAKGP